jgi:hypothetical protein
MVSLPRRGTTALNRPEHRPTLTTPRGNGGNPGRPVQSIYRVEGDTLWVGGTGARAVRPKSFDEKEIIIFIYTRVRK